MYALLSLFVHRYHCIRTFLIYLLNLKSNVKCSILHLFPVTQHGYIIEFKLTIYNKQPQCFNCLGFAPRLKKVGRTPSVFIFEYVKAISATLNENLYAEITFDEKTTR